MVEGKIWEIVGADLTCNFQIFKGQLNDLITEKSLQVYVNSLLKEMINFYS